MVIREKTVKDKSGNEFRIRLCATVRQRRNKETGIREYRYTYHMALDITSGTTGCIAFFTNAKLESGDHAAQLKAILEAK